MINSTDKSPIPREQAIEELREAAVLVGRRGISTRARVDIICGPETPLRYFTAGAFAAAYDTSRTLTDSNHPDMCALRAAIMEVFLHFNSDHVKMQSHLGAWATYTLSSEGPPVLKSDSGFIIDLFYSTRESAGESGRASKSTVFFGHRKSYEYKVCERIQNPIVDVLKRLLSNAINSGVIAGHPALLFPEYSDTPVRNIAHEILKALKNSPTAKRIEGIGRQETPGRFRFVDELHATQKDSSAIPGVLTYFESLPALLLTRGWCEGLAIHDASQYGAADLIQGIRAAIDQHGQSLYSQIRNKEAARDRYTFKDLLKMTDRDGATPLHRAALGGHWAIAEEYIALGADPAQTDRYGWNYNRYRNESPE